MDSPPPSRKEHRPRGLDFGERSQEQPMKMESNKAFHPYGAQGAPRVNADVGSEYMATARPMDPPQERCEPRRPRGNDFGPKPGTADE